MPWIDAREKRAAGSVAICPGLGRDPHAKATAPGKCPPRDRRPPNGHLPMNLNRVTLPADAPIPGKASMIALSINGKIHNVDVEADTPLLWVLRDTIGLTGTRYGCGIAQCGACTVHIDGVATRSCQVPVGTLGARRVSTIEALLQDGRLHPVQQAWIDHDVPQCGYCQSD